MKKLTKEQSLVVEENFALVTSYCYKYNVSEEDVDLIYIALCEAVIAHNPEKGRLSTLFHTCANRKLFKHQQKMQKQIQSPISIDIYDSYFPFKEIHSEDYTYQNVLDELNFNQCMSVLEDDEISIINELYSGKTQTELAKSKGVHQCIISRKVTKIKNKIEEFDRHGYNR